MATKVAPMHSKGGASQFASRLSSIKTRGDLLLAVEKHAYRSQGNVDLLLGEDDAYDYSFYEQYVTAKGGVTGFPSLGGGRKRKADVNIIHVGGGFGARPIASVHRLDKPLMTSCADALEALKGFECGRVLRFLWAAEDVPTVYLRQAPVPHRDLHAYKIVLT